MRRLLLLAALLAPASADARTLADLRTDVRTLVLDTGTRLRHSTSTIDGLINEGQRKAVMDTKALTKSAALELVAGTTFYNLPSDYWQMRRVTYKYQVLDEASPEYLDSRAGRSWETSPGGPTNYFISFASRTKVGFYPFPGTSASTGTVRYEYFAQPEDLDAAADEAFGGAAELDPYGDLPAYYAAAILAAIDGRVDLAVFYRGYWQDGLARMAREVVARPRYAPNVVPGTGSNRVGP